MSETGDPVYTSPSSLAVYATCPRQYEYDKVWDVNTPEESRRYLDRGLVYHDAIEETCAAVADTAEAWSDEEIRHLGRETIETLWDAQTDRSEYSSDAQYRYDRQLTISAIESYFETDGCIHARNSLAREVWIESERDGVHIRGRADHIVETERGLQIIDYKGSFNGIVSGQSREGIEAHHEGEAYNADILGSVFQAAAYIEGVKNSQWYEAGMDIEFTYYALMDDTERTPGLDGIEVAVSGRPRDVGWIYDAHEEAIWALIEDCYAGITAGRYRPEPWDEIRENACEDCAYQSMCGEYIGAEVGFDE